MQGVIVIYPEPLDIPSLLAAYKDTGDVEIDSPTRIIVQGDWGWFDVDFEQDDDFIALYKKALQEKIHAAIEKPYFAHIQHRGELAADLAIERFPDKGEVLVDNDHDLILPIAEVRRRIKAGEKWQLVWGDR